MSKSFVIIPIGVERFDKVFNHIIEPAMQECSIGTFRAQELTNEIFNLIPTYDLCIIVYSRDHPLLFYQTAIAKCAGRPLIFLKEKREILPFYFDFSEEYSVTYDLNDPIDLKVAIKEIVNMTTYFEENDWEVDKPFEFEKIRKIKDLKSLQKESTKKCYIIRPIGKEKSDLKNHVDEVIDYIIKPALKECGIKPYSVLDFDFIETSLETGLLSDRGLSSLSDQVYEAILTMDMCIAILTFPDPFVFYELGIAHFESRPVIKLMDKETYNNAPFALRKMKDFILYIYQYLSFTSVALDRTYTRQIVEYIRDLEAADWKVPNFPFKDIVIQNEFNKYIKKRILPTYREITFDSLSSNTGLELQKIVDFIEEMILKGEINAKIQGSNIIFTPTKASIKKSPIEKKVKESLDVGHDVFICYSSNDKDVADATCHFLEQQGIKCWIAPRDISTGSYASSIVEAIENSKLMVLIFTNSVNFSNHVKRELELAVSNGITIQPFRTEAVEPTSELKYYLSSMHWLDALTPPLEDHLSKLAKMVFQLL